MLSKEFLDKFPDFPEHMGELAKFVYYRTYSRWLPEKGRRETWKETCARAVDYNCSLAPISTGEDEQLFRNMFNLKQFISGRSLWIGGTEAANKAPLAGFNCAFTVIDSLKAFCDLFYLLMVGTGVGFRILPTDVNKLPVFRTDVKLTCFNHGGKWGDPTTVVEHVGETGLMIKIGDSKEGWVQALEEYLAVMTDDSDFIKNIYLDFSNIRPKGTPLKTFGGTASGYKSLQEMFEKIHKIILGSDKGKLRPINCLDICNIIGQNVVVGGVRRTAEIAIISPDDEECVNAKRNITDETRHRYMSNNSVWLEKKPTLKQLMTIFDSIKECGEPGFINVQEGRRRREDFSGMNPCLTGNMKLLTKQGYVPVETLANKGDVDIVSYDARISKGRVWYTGDKECISLKLSNNKEITCTPNHVFMLNDGTEEKAENLVGKRLMPFLQAPVDRETKFVKLGFIQGDATLSDLKNPDKKGFGINIGVKDKDIANMFDIDFDPSKGRITHYTADYVDDVKRLGFSIECLPMRTLPTTINDWSPQAQLNFLRGLYSANGSVIKTGKNNVRIGFKTTCKELAMQLLSLLADFDIHAYVTVNKERKTEFANGTYLCKESYDVNIQRYMSKVRFFNYIGFVQTYKTEALFLGLLASSSKVKGKRSIGVKPVYDFTEPINHWGVVEGYVTHNCAEVILPPNGVCNLTTINLPAFVLANGSVDWDGLREAIRLSARAAYRMTCLDLELEGWNEVHHRDRLLGCSITGYQDFIGSVGIGVERDFLNETHSLTRRFADEYADSLGMSRSLKVTAVKPEGTLSLVANGVSAGLHYQHSPYFIRRIRVNASDPLAKTALELGWQIHPEVGQTMEDATTLVIDFPCKAIGSVTKNDVTAWKQLHNYILFQLTYTEMNTSNTITVKPDEWDDVLVDVYNNWDDILAVTFLQHDGKAYPLMPYEECTKEEYEELKAKMKPFDEALLNKYEFDTQNMGKEFEILDDREGCENGVCPIR